VINERPKIVTVDDRATEHVVEFCRAEGRKRLLMLADQNTWAAQGAELAAALEAAHFDVAKVIYQSAEVVADAHHIFQAMIAADDATRTLIAVGSGTITDIARFTAHRTRADFISIPTAPSVDAYVSVGAPLILGGVKITYLCGSPIAVFADIDVLTAAPRAMIAAGVGDVLAKFTSTADFRLGHLLWDEPYDDAIAHRMLATAWRTANGAAEIGAGDAAGVRALIYALFDSGYCMVDFGNSRPASGTEHHYSHFWEMRLLHEGRPAILHGAKTGVGTALAAALYEQVRGLTRSQISDLLEAAVLPDRDQEMAAIRRVYGDLADEMIAGQQPFLEMTTERFDALKRRILERWEDVQKIAADVPSPGQIAGWLAAVGGPTNVQELGLSQQELSDAGRYAHYLRNRFTVRKLAGVLGLTES
jgi:glycerol-1-phosphate dehydrogenase [NAD(P)+]